MSKNRKPHRVFIDQWGQKFYAHTIKELRQQVGGGSVHIMYRDYKDGHVERIGYVIGEHWMREYAPVIRPA